MYPFTDHQLWFVHLQRNIKKYMSKADSQAFNRELGKKNYLQHTDEALSKFESLCETYKSKYPRYINLLREKTEFYFAFSKYPDAIRKYIYTTNAVESINSMIEKVRIRSGGYFNSIETLEINIYLLRENLIKNKWKNPVPMIAAYSYDIQQIFQLKYFI